ncbi:MAG: macrolide transporter subunit MacA [Burkholderiales bacterium]|jgi:macrolide-specific efflux system membrane fusion protein|nr:macrolide transporter subunit MacA [Burkholderiales bacterium]
MKKKIIGTLVTILVLMAGFFGVRALFFTPSSPSYLTVPVTREDIEELVLATGALEPIKQVNVGAQVNGQLKSLKVKLGDRVKKGDLLAEVDPVLQENDLRNAEASLESVKAQKRAQQAQLEQYELAYERQKQMIQAEASSQAELEAAQAQVKSARAGLDSLDAQIHQATIRVDTARANLGYTRIIAPMDGEVIALITQEGQTVVSAQSAPTILILADLDTMTVKAQISEADVVRIRPGLPVYFTILGVPNKKRHSTLRTVEPAPDTITSSGSMTSSASSTTAIYYNGLFDVENTDHVLRTFMTAQVSIVLGTAKDVLSIPVTALGDRTRGGYRVRVLVNGAPEERVIKTGLNNNVRVEILEGLVEGDQVIVGEGSKGDQPAAAPRRPIRI